MGVDGLRTSGTVRLAAMAATALTLVCGTALAAPAPQPTPAAAAQGDNPGAHLAAHRAVYDLSLGKSEGSNAPASATGRIAFDFTGSACEGWVMNFRQLTQLQPAEGEQRTSDMRSSTYEDGDGKSFQFKSETLVNGKPSDTVDGSAKKSEDGALSLKLARPAPAKLDLDASVVFPTEQIERLLTAAHNGEHTLSMKVFDGSDTGQKVYDTLAVIGKPLDAPPPDRGVQIDAMKNMKRWPVSVSYFDSKKQDGTPEYVLSFDLYDNGVSGALKLDYGDFVLAGELTKLDLLPQKACK